MSESRVILLGLLKLRWSIKFELKYEINLQLYVSFDKFAHRYLHCVLL